MEKSLPAKGGDARDRGSVPGVGRSLGEGNGNPTPVLLPRKAYGQRSLVGYSPWGSQRVGCDRAHTSRAGEVVHCLVPWGPCEGNRVTQSLSLVSLFERRGERSSKKTVPTHPKDSFKNRRRCPQSLKSSSRAARSENRSLRFQLSI